MRKGLFLDRDGVINHDPGDYTKSLAEFEVLPKVYDALLVAQKKGYTLILVTNQGGVAKGLYPIENVHEIHNYFRTECTKRGIEIAEIYFAPYHDDFGMSLSRKPGSMMVERGLAKYGLDASQSYIVGDKERDLESGAKVGVRGIKIDVNGSLYDAVQKLD